MAMFGMGVMLGPILGPSLGAYLTEYYNWRWVFFINVPLGVIALIGIQAAIKDPAHRERDRPFDLGGFALLSIAIGSLQLMLDRGNTQLWFQSTRNRHRRRRRDRVPVHVHRARDDEGPAADRTDDVQRPQFQRAG